jgi:hypothetical protein
MRLFLDIECYKNYFLVLFTDDKGRSKSYEMFEGNRGKFDRQEIFKLINHKDVELVTFNGNSYDIPMLTMALAGYSNDMLKDASDQIITRNLRPWAFYKMYNLDDPQLNHIDLIEVSPGIVSLKIYGGRLHSPKLQDLPIAPDAVLSRDEATIIRKYCKNDTLVTRDLYNELQQQVELRRTMSEEYKVDLRSKSDAQIAEAVLKTEYARLTGDVPPKTEITYTSFYYEPPAYVKFITEDLKEKLEIIKQSEMVIKDTGHVEMPKAISDMKITIGNTAYKIGIGGLHSQESEMAHKADDEYLLVDRDVASYYPNLMLNMDMSPPSFGDYFSAVYRKILDERLAAKRAGNKVKADSLKIVLNGTFGKTSNRYSLLYSPKMMIRTTLTGQLSLLMLIEMLESLAIPVVSANTDGVVIKCPVAKKPLLDKVIAKWEARTNLETEETAYSALYSRDVNNYIAIKPDGSVKTKGVYGSSGIWKNPQNEICSIAVSDYLSKGTSCAQTIHDCNDIRKFLTVRTVNGGAVKDGIVLGKAVRWYYAKGETGSIHYLKNNNTVPRSEGAKPLMDLPDEFPNDVDYKWYEDECKEILLSLGAIVRPIVEKLPRKNSKAWKALFEAGEIFENKKGKWEWVHPEQHLGHSAA